MKARVTFPVKILIHKSLAFYVAIQLLLYIPWDFKVFVVACCCYIIIPLLSLLLLVMTILVVIVEMVLQL